MKKSLLALAVLSSIAGAASAQSSVTIYGVVDAGIAHETGGAAGSVTKVATGVESGNRLGFKGTEDLGNGLKALFLLESGFNLDDGTQRQPQTTAGGASNARLFGRQAFAGLSGGFGEIDLGRQYTRIFGTINMIDPFGTGLGGSAANMMNSGGGRPSTNIHLNPEAVDVRVDNAITYSIPTTNGFNASAMYALGEVVGDNKAGRTLGLSGSYANGPVMLVAAYNKVSGAAAPAATTALPSPLATPDSKLLLVGGTYNFGVATANLGYETEKNSLGDNFRDILIGTTVPVGPAGNLMASFIKRTDKFNTGAAMAGAKMYAIGYDYNLSKRTNLYVSYARISNDGDGTTTPASGYTPIVVGDASGGGTAVPHGQTSGGFVVGLRHKF